MNECEHCPFRLWPVRCFAAVKGSKRLCELSRTSVGYREFIERKTLTAVVDSQSIVRPQVTADQARAIELCIVRTSDCNCLGKPATCMRSGTPERIVCLHGGPDGGICPGVDRLGG